MKNDVDVNYTNLDATLQTIKKRVKYLIDSEKIQPSTQEQTCLHEIQLNKVTIDMLLRMGYFQTAKKMIQTYKLEEFMNFEQQIITEAYLILKDLSNHSTSEALNWCKANRTRLIKSGSQLEYQLIFQTYIEFLRNNKEIDGLIYIQKSINKIGENLYKRDYIQKAMGCLFLIKQIEKFPEYSYYFEQQRWIELMDKFKIELQNIYCLQVIPPLQITLQAGLSTLKSIYCSIQEFQRPSVCPLCNKMLEKILLKLPSTQKLESTWICRITGEIMDENNPPMVLPNNQVYSQKALNNMAQKLKGKIICPISKLEFNLNDAIRVYLS